VLSRLPCCAETDGGRLYVPVFYWVDIFAVTQHFQGDIKDHPDCDFPGVIREAKASSGSVETFVLQQLAVVRVLTCWEAQLELPAGLGRSTARYVVAARVVSLCARPVRCRARHATGRRALQHGAMAQPAERQVRRRAAQPSLAFRHDSADTARPMPQLAWSRAAHGHTVHVSPPP
jgi:hypothetical protein